MSRPFRGQGAAGLLQTLPRVSALERPVLDLVIPVYNEVAGLERSVRTVRTYLDDCFPYTARVTIADNASTDGTLAVARALAEELPGVRAVYLPAKGRGRALRSVWLDSDADVLAYMDVDLSTDLSALLPLIAPLVSGHSHLAIGTRLSRTSRVVRGPKRELISRCYNVLLRGSLAAHFSDAQCGFKAIRADAARELLPLVQDSGWFFDTELLVLAERAGLRIHEVPVDWVDDPDSRVDLIATATADLRGIARLGRDLMTGRLPLREISEHLPLVGDRRPLLVDGRPVEASAAAPGSARATLLHQVVRFGVVGVASTAAYTLLYLLLRGPLSAQGANFAALLLTAIANTAANRRLTFGFRGPDGAIRHQGQGLIVFALGWGLTAGSLAGLHAAAPTAPHAVELAVLVVANLAATVLRFVMLRRWVFRPRTSATTTHVLNASATPTATTTEGSPMSPMPDTSAEVRLGSAADPAAPTTAAPTAEALSTEAPTAEALSTEAPSGAAPSRPPRTRWERPALVGLLLITATLYLWDLSASGWANSFYSAAVQAGSKSWTAFLYGASDAAGSITVDKPPASLWVMALSVRVFGLSSWSILVPQALMGVATVGVLYASVRRRFSPQAALLAGAVLALTPVAALMFRFNNPDALLVLLLTLAAYATLRAVEDGRTRWMVLAGVLVGFGFLTKQLQAFLVLPGFALAYLIAAPVPMRRRIRDGLLAVGALVLAAGWWVALVELVPASMRPYVGGSQTNSFLELTFGYNGLGRLTGSETGGIGGGTNAVVADAFGRPGGAGGAGGFSSQSGLGRMFASEAGGQIAWLIPAALVLGLVALWLRRRTPRTDAPRAALLVWGSWLIVTLLTFSLMAGIFHAYYTVALAPAIAALVGIGAAIVWEHRAKVWAVALLATVTLGTCGWAFVLLGRSADWLPLLRWAVLVVGLVAAAGLLAGHWLGARVLTVGTTVAIVASLAGATAYTLQTVATPHTGSIVTAGPTVARGMGGFPGGRPGAPGEMGALPGGTGGTPDGPGGQPPAGMRMGESAVSSKVTALLLKDADSYTWVAATVGADNAAGYQLATEKSVMPIGGFSGSDPAPTFSQFTSYVAAGKIHYFLGADPAGPAGGRAGRSSDISAWVTAHFTAQTVDGVTLYDLTQPRSSATS